VISDQVLYDESISVEEIEQQSNGEQEESRCKILYYKVCFTRDSKQFETKQMISKEALLLERRILALLCEQKQAVPPTFIPNISSERSRFYQIYTDPFDPVTKAYAYALAQIHYINLGQHPEWLPLATENFGSSIWLYQNLQLNMAVIEIV
jgi:hypothetical protein